MKPCLVNTLPQAVLSQVRNHKNSAFAWPDCTVCYCKTQRRSIP